MRFDKTDYFIIGLMFTIVFGIALNAFKGPFNMSRGTLNWTYHIKVRKDSRLAEQIKEEAERSGEIPNVVVQRLIDGINENNLFERAIASTEEEE